MLERGSGGCLDAPRCRGVGATTTPTSGCTARQPDAWAATTASILWEAGLAAHRSQLEDRAGEGTTATAQSGEPREEEAAGPEET